MLNELLQGAVKAIPGYMEGQQQAVRDNWQDLNQYNQVKQGQLGNLFNEATFGNRVLRDYDQTAMSDLNLANAERFNYLEDLNLPIAAYDTLTKAKWTPLLAPQRYRNAYTQGELTPRMNEAQIQNIEQQIAMMEEQVRLYRQMVSNARNGVTPNVGVQQ